MQAIIDADMQACMDKGRGRDAEASRQRETGGHEAEGGSQVGAGSRHAVR
jgi:hypothetical protein